jgi:hypothetical protein
MPGRREKCSRAPLHAGTTTLGPRVKQGGATRTVHLRSVDTPTLAPTDPRRCPTSGPDARAANLICCADAPRATRPRRCITSRFSEGSRRHDHVAEWAYHDLDHLRQILSVLSADLYPHIGPFQALYATPS